VASVLRFKGVFTATYRGRQFSSASRFTAGAFRFLILNRRRIALLNRKKGAAPFSGPEFTGGNAPLMTTVQR